MSWTQLEAEAPELARLARERLSGRLVFLGTLRADGSPRVSPVEVFFVGGELVVGVMRSLGKAPDLRRDPRVAVQSALVEPDAGEPELKLYGRLEPSDVAGGWWEGRPGDADVYRLAIAEAVHIEWHVGAGTMQVRRWTPAAGETVTERAYP